MYHLIMYHLIMYNFMRCTILCHVLFEKSQISNLKSINNRFFALVSILFCTFVADNLRLRVTGT